MASSEQISEYDISTQKNFIFANYRRLSLERLRMAFKPGDRVVDIGAGTGEEAVALARLGVSVIALEPSKDLLFHAMKKVKRYKLKDKVDTVELPAEEIMKLAEEFGLERLDGAYASFGVLNCVSNLPKFALDLSSLLKPKAPFVTSVMNKTNLWEMSAYMMMLRPKAAFRRFGVQRAPIMGIPDQRFEVRYYTREELREIFGESFRFESVQSYPLMPPPTFNGIFGKLPGYLNWAGKKGNGRLNGFGDHIFVIMERI